MDREEAIKLLQENIANQNLIKHCFAVEAIMRALARHFSEGEEDKSSSSPFAIAREDEGKWALAGLLHDIDYEKVKDDMSQHSLLGAKMLENLGVGKDICQAVKVHNEAHGVAPETLLEKSLFATDPLTGLIVAATLVLPSKKIADLTLENVLNRFREKAFAKGANREIIGKCQELLNLKLEEFVEIGLKAMQGISQELGL
ncbi:MAG: HD domain-containing protein [bacterium]